MKHSFRDMRLKRKLALLFSAAIALVGATALVSAQSLVDSYNDALYRQSASALSAFALEFSAAVQSCANLSDYLLSNPTLQDNMTILLESQDNLQRKKAISDLSSLLMSNASFHPAILCLRIEYPDSALTIGKNSAVDVPLDHERLNSAARAQDGAIAYEKTGGDPPVLALTRLVKRIQHFDLRTLGTLTVYLNLDTIVQKCRDSLDIADETRLYLLKGDQFIYPDGAGSQTQLLGLLGDPAPYSIQPLDGRRRFLVVQSAAGTPLTCIMAADYDAIFRRQINAYSMFMIVIAAATAVTLLLSNVTVSAVLVHIGRLLEKIRLYRESKPVPASLIEPYAARMDEIGVLHSNFDQMTQQITSLVEENYKKLLLLKDTQLRALEQQINPHFLYNTLNTISWEAEACNAPTIPTVVNALSSLLRITLSEQRDVIPFETEMEIVTNYMQIQQIRFGARLMYQTEIDPASLALSVPKMSVQPLVENAVRFALEKSPEDCAITVTAKTEGEIFLIEVQNNGSSIDEDILEKLRDGMVRPMGFGIGLSNIDMRAKLIFGQDYGLAFQSADDITVVSMRLPAIAYEKEGNLRAENDDRG